MIHNDTRKVFEHDASQYALADKSDPFALNRAMTHVNNGVAGFRFDNNGSRHDAFYKATQVTETRELPAGSTFSDGSTKYEGVVYRDIQRP